MDLDQQFNEKCNMTYDDDDDDDDDNDDDDEEGFSTNKQ